MGQICKFSAKTKKIPGKNALFQLIPAHKGGNNLSAKA